MSKPLIGIPMMGTSFFRKYMQGKYISSLKRSGAKVLLLEQTSDRNTLKEYVTKCDGFVIPGGADIDPSLYGQARMPVCGKPNEQRDAMEYAFLQLILAHKKPVLCICRGMQMLNVVAGGTLHQDIKEKQQYPHSDFLHRAKTTHPVILEENTLLSTIFPSGEVLVNSIHHQAVAQLGNGLICSAKSKDGFVEAIEMPDIPFCVGVQWHPEHMTPKDVLQTNLFEAFIQASSTKLHAF